MSTELKVAAAGCACIAAAALWTVRDSLVVLLLLLEFVACPPHKGALFQCWESPAAPLQVRVEAYHERCGGLLPGAYYRFLSRPAPDAPWADVMEVRHDDPLPIPSHQVRLVSPTIAYCYMGTKLAVTTDGASWCVWDLLSDAGFKQVADLGSIRVVDIDGSGRGRMQIECYGLRGPRQAEMATLDYGITWSVVAQSDARRDSGGECPTARAILRAGSRERGEPGVRRLTPCAEGFS